MSEKEYFVEYVIKGSRLEKDKQTQIKYLKSLRDQVYASATLLRCAGFGGYEKLFKENSSNTKRKYSLENPDTWCLCSPKDLRYNSNEKFIENESELKLIADSAQKGIRQFAQWYYEKYVIVQKGCCCYCGVPEEVCNELLSPEQKRKNKRGIHLEPERIKSQGEENIYCATNCALACYVCNNAKSNIFTLQEFQPIAKQINEWWNAKLKNSCLKDKYLKIEFPTDIWSKGI